MEDFAILVEDEANKRTGRPLKGELEDSGQNERFLLVECHKVIQELIKDATQVRKCMEMDGEATESGMNTVDPCLFSRSRERRG